MVTWILFQIQDVLPEVVGVYPRIAAHLLFLALLVTRCCGHNIQWVLASLFVVCAAIRAMEVFTVWK